MCNSSAVAERVSTPAPTSTAPKWLVDKQGGGTIRGLDYQFPEAGRGTLWLSSADGGTVLRIDSNHEGGIDIVRFNGPLNVRDYGCAD
jgi:hypothetical protein